MSISLVNGVNPLQTTLVELGIVSSRVALLPRSAEIQPGFEDLSSNTIRYSPPLSLMTFCYRAGQGCCQGFLKSMARLGSFYSVATLHVLCNPAVLRIAFPESCYRASTPLLIIKAGLAGCVVLHHCTSCIGCWNPALLRIAFPPKLLQGELLQGEHAPTMRTTLYMWIGRSYIDLHVCNVIDIHSSSGH